MGQEEIASADASVLIFLAKAARLSILREVFDEVRVDAAVEKECLLGLPGRADARTIEAALESGALARANAPPAKVRAVAKRHSVLGAGEIGAIALASEGGLLLSDDALARRAARLEGCTPVGTLGILTRAYRRGALRKDEIGSALRDVLNAGLWVDASVVEEFWAKLGIPR